MGVLLEEVRSRLPDPPRSEGFGPEESVWRLKLRDMVYRLARANDDLSGQLAALPVATPVLYDTGDLLVGLSPELVRLPIGTAGYILTSVGGTAVWAAPPAAVTTVAFSAITAGVNTLGAAMVVGNTSSLNYSGTGTINASTLINGTWAIPGTIGSTTPNTGVFTTLQANSTFTSYLDATYSVVGQWFTGSAHDAAADGGAGTNVWRLRSPSNSALVFGAAGVDYWWLTWQTLGTANLGSLLPTAANGQSVGSLKYNIRNVYCKSVFFNNDGTASSAGLNISSTSGVAIIDNTSNAGAGTIHIRSKTSAAIILQGGGTNSFQVNTANHAQALRRFIEAEGANVASTGNMTLGSDGNAFHITGTTTINSIVVTNWVAGAVITLYFDNATPPQLTDMGGASGQFRLAGTVNWTPTQDSTITLRLTGTTWTEIARMAR